jgi:hypothetical protein
VAVITVELNAVRAIISVRKSVDVHSNVALTIAPSFVIVDLVHPVSKLRSNRSFALVEGQNLHRLYVVGQNLLNVLIRVLSNRLVATQKLPTVVMQWTKIVRNAHILWRKFVCAANVQLGINLVSVHKLGLLVVEWHVEHCYLVDFIVVRLVGIFPISNDQTNLKSSTFSRGDKVFREMWKTS